MKEKYIRITYDNIGIYEALKKTIWEYSNNPKEEWYNLKNNPAFTWLKTPPTYNVSNYSFFNELGFNLFMKNTYPLIIKYLDEQKINIKEYLIDITSYDALYQDEYQIVIEKR